MFFESAYVDALTVCSDKSKFLHGYGEGRGRGERKRGEEEGRGRGERMRGQREKREEGASVTCGGGDLSIKSCVILDYIHVYFSIELLEEPKSSVVQRVYFVVSYKHLYVGDIHRK